MITARKYRRSLPTVNCSGVIQIADVRLNCCVLDNGKRLISEIDIHEQLGKAGGKLRQLRKNLVEKHGGPIPLFLASKPLIPLIEKLFLKGT